MKFRIVTTLCLLSLGLPALAVEEGSLGVVSSSRFTISLAIEPSIEINTASDIAITINDRGSDADFLQSFCVQGTTSGRYTINASGNTGTGSAFRLRNENGEVLPYSISYDGNPNGDTFEQLYPNQASTPYAVIPRSDICEEQTSFRVRFLATDLQQAGPGLYSGSLTLLVSPV